MKSKYVEYGGKLALICAVCMVGVAGAFVMARDRIEDGKAAAVTNAIREVLGLKVDDPDPKPLDDSLKEDEQVYVVEAGGTISYAAQGAWQGFSSKVRVAVGARKVDGKLKIIEVRVISQNETPGLGTRIQEQETNLTLWSSIGNLLGAGVEEEKDWAFLKQYRDKGIENMMLTDDRGLAAERIVKMTGVTITTNAATMAVKQALARILEAAP